MSSRIIEVDILVERRPGHLTKGIRHQLDMGWDWDGKVMLSSTDGFVAVFTKSEDIDVIEAEKAEAEAEAKKQAAAAKRAATIAAKKESLSSQPKVGIEAKDVKVTSGAG